MTVPAKYEAVAARAKEKRHSGKAVAIPSLKF